MIFRERLIGLLEVSDFDNVNQVSPPLVSVLAVLYGNESSAEVTAVFTVYVGFITFLFSRQVKSFWTTETLSKLKEKIKEFKNTKKNVFENYQLSNEGTEMWHMLDHIVENIREVGGVEYLHAVIYECAHRIIKRDCKRSLLKKKLALEETFGKPTLVANVHQFQELRWKSDKDNLQKYSQIEWRAVKFHFSQNRKIALRSLRYSLSFDGARVYSQ